MNELSNDIEPQPSCVAQLLNCLSEVADAFQAGKPVGPYIAESLLEDVELCPALEQTDDDGAHVRLEQALEKTRNSIRVAMVCPMVKRDWAAQELRNSISNAQDCLDRWRMSAHTTSGRSDENTRLNDLARIDSPRCRNCAFAGPVLTEPKPRHG
jgi:hypothetical protein